MSNCGPSALDLLEEGPGGLLIPVNLASRKERSPKLFSLEEDENAIMPHPITRASQFQHTPSWIGREC